MMIDRIKIGNFLRELRNEKGITQEKLAERYGVSSRSVSRWENGNTMPDLGILVELADYYQIDIGEIIDGERKSENMSKDTKETLVKVADYAEMEKMMLVRKKEFNFLGKILFVLFAVSLIVLLDLKLMVSVANKTHNDDNIIIITISNTIIPLLFFGLFTFYSLLSFEL